uniref:Uncharacterized protein n=1 Tax=Anguilla anguilla TaxID=7936 RepID=A0A0E9QDE5_ANGAN
MFETEGSLFC